MTKQEAALYLEKFLTTVSEDEGDLIRALDVAIRSLISEVTRDIILGGNQFSDAECRIFLSAMSREMKVCSQLDKEAKTEDCVILTDICRSIIRKITDILFG